MNKTEILSYLYPESKSKSMPTHRSFSIQVEKGRRNDHNFLDKFFLKVYGGYGLLTPGSYTVSSTNQIAWTEPDGNSFQYLDTLVKNQAKRGLGSGLHLGLGVGFIKNDFLNFGLDAVYVPGSGLKNSLTTLVHDNVYQEVSDAIEYGILTLTPHAIFKALAKPKFFLYNKLGVMITLPFTMKTKGASKGADALEFPHSFVFLDSNYYPDVLFRIVSEAESSYSTDYKMSLGVGLNIAFGINFRINDKTRVFGEIFGNYSALTPSNSTSSTYRVSQTRNIIDSTNFHYESVSKTISTSSSHTQYEQGGVIGITGSQFEDLGIDAEGYRRTTEIVRGTAQKYTINMSTVGINIGLVYRF